MEKAVKSGKKYMGFKEVLAYSAGLFGMQAVIFYLNSYQAEFYNMSMGADLAIVGIILLVGKVLSAFFDPFVGQMIERKKDSELGKLKPFMKAAILPLALLTVLIFIPLPFSKLGAAYKPVMYIYIFITYTLWCMAMTLGDVPSQGIAAVLTPDTDERTNMLGFANTLKSIGQSAPFVIVPLVCLLVPGGAGFEGKLSATEYLVSAIVIAVLGMGLFSLIIYGTKERVPYTAEAMTLKEMLGVLKGNKPLILLMVSYFLGFARQAAMAIQVQAATAILGSANKLLILALPTGIGTMISMALTPLIVKKLGEKTAFIAMSIYGFVISLATYFVGYNTLWVMLVFLFLMGLQFGAVNVLPMIMAADCADYCEYKTGRRAEGLVYAVLSLSIKVTLAMGAAIALIMLSVVGYDAAAEAVTDKVKDGVYLTYTVIPGITSLLAAIPIFFYTLTGANKKEMSAELAARREGKESVSAEN